MKALVVSFQPGEGPSVVGAYSVIMKSSRTFVWSSTAQCAEDVPGRGGAGRPGHMSMTQNVVPGNATLDRKRNRTKKLNRFSQHFVKTLRRWIYIFFAAFNFQKFSGGTGPYNFVKCGNWRWQTLKMHTVTLQNSSFSCNMPNKLKQK